MVTLRGSGASYVGLSTDDKPTDVPINTIFTELDTNADYYYTGEGWEKVGGESVVVDDGEG